VQLKNKKQMLVLPKHSVRHALTVATCTVLSSSISVVSFAEEEVSGLVYRLSIMLKRGVFQ